MNEKTENKDYKILIVDDITENLRVLGNILFIEEYKMIKPGERILVAVSGGKDSMALLHFLSENAVSLECELVAANLDHGLRGSEGQLEAKMIRAFCEKRKIFIR